MKKKLIKINLIIIEDSEDDAILLLRSLKNPEFIIEYIICDDLLTFEKEILTDRYNLIISDYNLQVFTAIDAYKILRKNNLDIPFIIVSGAIGENLAVKAMKLGVNDYLMKDSLGRLVPAVKRELSEALIRKEQIKTQKALEFERHKSKLLIENAPIGIIIISNQGRIEYSNSQAMKIFGVPKQYTSLSTIIPVLFPDAKERDWILDFWGNTFNPSANLPDIDFPPVTTPEGTKKYVKFKSASIDHNSFILMTEDITSQKISAISLENSQKRLTQILNTIEDIVIEIISNNGVYLIRSINKSFIKSTGHSFYDVIDKEVDLIIKTRPNIRIFIEEAISNSETIRWETEIDFPSGKRYWENFIAPIFTANNELFRIILTSRDITDRKNYEINLFNSEKKYRIVSSIASDAIWEWSKEKNTIIWNEGIFSLFGYKENEVEPSIDWVKAKIHPNDIQYVEESMENIIRNEKGNWEIEFRFLCCDGSYKQVNSTSYIFFHNRMPVRIIGALVDMTHRQQAEELRIKSLVEGADNERKKIAEELHDNLGQKLSFVSILLEQVKDNYDEEKLKRARGIIKSSISDTRNMAHSLMPKSISDFGLKDAVLSLVDNLQLSHDLKINAHLNIKNRFTPKIETNLFRIIQEALNNIIKHAKARSIFIHLLDKDGNLSLTIEDDGIGFTQNTSSYKEGIGLKNIENRTYYLNGKCTIESKPGKGTLILIEIPV